MCVSKLITARAGPCEGVCARMVPVACKYCVMLNPLRHLWSGFGSYLCKCDTIAIHIHFIYLTFITEVHKLHVFHLHFVITNAYVRFERLDWIIWFRIFEQFHELIFYVSSNFHTVKQQVCCFGRALLWVSVCPPMRVKFHHIIHIGEANVQSVCSIRLYSPMWAGLSG